MLCYHNCAPCNCTPHRFTEGDLETEESTLCIPTQAGSMASLNALLGGQFISTGAAVCRTYLHRAGAAAGFTEGQGMGRVR